MTGTIRSRRRPLKRRRMAQGMACKFSAFYCCYIISRHPTKPKQTYFLLAACMFDDVSCLRTDVWSSKLKAEHASRSIKNDASFKSARCKTSWIESERGESIATRNPCFAIRAEALNADSYIFIQSVDVLQVRAQWGASSLPSQPAVSLFWCACAWKNLGNDAWSDSFRMIVHSERVNCHSCLLFMLQSWTEEWPQELLSLYYRGRDDWGQTFERYWRCCSACLSHPLHHILAMVWQKKFLADSLRPSADKAFSVTNYHPDMHSSQWCWFAFADSNSSNDAACIPVEWFRFQDISVVWCKHRFREVRARSLKTRSGLFEHWHGLEWFSYVLIKLFLQRHSHWRHMWMCQTILALSQNCFCSRAWHAVATTTCHHSCRPHF